MARFKPKNVKTHPLQCSNPKLSWEEGDLERKMKMKNAFESETKLEDFEFVFNFFTMGINSSKKFSPLIIS